MDRVSDDISNIQTEVNSKLGLISHQLKPSKLKVQNNIRTEGESNLEENTDFDNNKFDSIKKKISHKERKKYRKKKKFK